MFDPEAVRTRCNGMLAPSVYQHIYETARSAGGGVFVEVGTAHGAATVSLALGLKASGRQGHVHTFEKIVGGTRERFGSIAENEDIIRTNFRTFGVDDVVSLHIGGVDDLQANVREEREFALLMLDADGRIDRDFGYFFDRLRPGAPIIIDDVADLVRIKMKGSDRLTVDQKHRLTHLLVEAFTSAGLVACNERIRNTWFGTKREARWEDLPPSAVLAAYRSLVFGEADRPMRGLEKKWHRLTSRPRQ
ncbi:MAG: class I SAM-dependent methyltransferase [Alphaproteobacteria bacterium]|nr:class I SAM-dependent methyltransferase [Alphaproteobacteria bacterium]